MQDKKVICTVKCTLVHAKYLKLKIKKVHYAVKCTLVHAKYLKLKIKKGSLCS